MYYLYIESYNIHVMRKRNLLSHTVQAIWFLFEQVITPVSSRSAHSKEPLDPQWKDAASKELKGKKDVDSLVWKTPEVCKDLLLKLVTS